MGTALGPPLFIDNDLMNMSMTAAQSDLTAYRQSDLEQKRIGDLMRLLPQRGEGVLDVGARDGYISILLTQLFDRVTALDLETPRIKHDNVTCVKGDITALQFPDNYFDAVLCAEVLEHIPPSLLPKACKELARVTRSKVVIGVPYKQDTRLGRTTCSRCGEQNPPWGHVNEFDEAKLKGLFSGLTCEKISFVGESPRGTNFVATYLMDLAGNPYGTYGQDESCVRCGAKLAMPPARTLVQKVITKSAHIVRTIGTPFPPNHGNWIHVVFSKNSASTSAA